jgi:hypothetical protein
MVLAQNLSHAAILEGVALGRTVVKMYGPKSPMVHFQCVCNASAAGGGVVEVGGWCVGGGFLLASVTTTDADTVLTVLRNNAVTVQVQVPAGSFNFTWSAPVSPPVDAGADRWRAELREPGLFPQQPHTLTNHIFVLRD